MHCHCGTNNRAPRWTFTDPCKPEVRPGAREESASPVWLAAPAMNALDTTKVYTWRPETGCGPTLYRKCHSYNTPGKRHNNTWVEPLAGNCITSSTRQREQVWQKCKILCSVSMSLFLFGLSIYAVNFRGWDTKRLLIRCIRNFISDKLIIWTICAFRVLNPRQWSLAKQSTNVVQRVEKWCPESVETSYSCKAKWDK